MKTIKVRKAWRAHFPGCSPGMIFQTLEGVELVERDGGTVTPVSVVECAPQALQELLDALEVWSAKLHDVHNKPDPHFSAWRALADADARLDRAYRALTRQEKP